MAFPKWSRSSSLPYQQNICHDGPRQIERQLRAEHEEHAQRSAVRRRDQGEKYQRTGHQQSVGADLRVYGWIFEA